MTTISMDKQYTTRDGMPVRLLCVDGPLPYPVVGLVAGDETPACWTADGGYMQEEVSCHDLIEAKPRVQCEAWAYKHSTTGKYRLVFSDDAFLHGQEWKLVARVPIDVEEGHGLEGGE